MLLLQMRLSNQSPTLSDRLHVYMEGNIECGYSCDSSPSPTSECRGCSCDDRPAPYWRTLALGSHHRAYVQVADNPGVGRQDAITGGQLLGRSTSI